MKKRLPHTRLAEGEVTGHYHEAVGEDCALFEDWTLDAPNGCEVTHQEHKTVEIPPGEYERSIVQEFDHAEQEARDTRD
jgi:hypothetical protein